MHWCLVGKRECSSEAFNAALRGHISWGTLPSNEWLLLLLWFYGLRFLTLHCEKDHWLCLTHWFNLKIPVRLLVLERNLSWRNIVIYPNHVLLRIFGELYTTFEPVPLAFNGNAPKHPEYSSCTAKHDDSPSETFFGSLPNKCDLPVIFDQNEGVFHPSPHLIYVYGISWSSWIYGISHNIYFWACWSFSIRIGFHGKSSAPSSSKGASPGSNSFSN